MVTFKKHLDPILQSGHCSAYCLSHKEGDCEKWCKWIPWLPAMYDQIPLRLRRSYPEDFKQCRNGREDIFKAYLSLKMADYEKFVKGLGDYSQVYGTKSRKAMLDF